jgi:Ca2+-binding EF-hand superfamily protein
LTANAKPDELVSLLVEKFWDKYDVDGSGALDRRETRCLSEDIFGTVGGHCSRAEFNKLFVEMDFNGDGFIDKHEMNEFLQNLR